MTVSDSPALMARRRRVRAIRGWVVALAVSLYIAVGAVIVVHTRASTSTALISSALPERGRVLGVLGLIERVHWLPLELRFRRQRAPDHEPVLMAVVSPPSSEAVERFHCYGGTCTVRLQGHGPAGDAPRAVQRIRRRLLDWHAQFSRFDPASELSRLNSDPRVCVPVSPMMTRFAQAAIRSAALTGGLVDPTLVSEIEAAGHTDDLSEAPVPLGAVRALAPARRPAAPSACTRWRQVAVDRRAGTVSRPVGVRLDSGGVAKGLFGDVLGVALGGHEAFALDAAGDIVFGGTGRIVRALQVASPSGADVLHTFELARGAVATSGITKRSWIDGRGRPAHHVLDPSTGQPAFTGVVQATALAPSGVEAEALAKAALLAGRQRATEWLRHGGVVVYDDGGYAVVEPRRCQGLE